MGRNEILEVNTRSGQEGGVWALIYEGTGKRLQDSNLSEIKPGESLGHQANFWWLGKRIYVKSFIHYKIKHKRMIFCNL